MNPVIHLALFRAAMFKYSKVDVNVCLGEYVPTYSLL